MSIDDYHELEEGRFVHIPTDENGGIVGPEEINDVNILNINQKKENGSNVIQKQWVNCSDCHGKGINNCYTCGGKGRIECSNCYGKGYTSYNDLMCTACGGRGERQCTGGCYGKGTASICSYCNGRGQVLVTY
jgi:hypothetical protein